MYSDSQQAVAESLRSGMPLLIYVDRPDDDTFFRARLSDFDAVLAKFVTLRVHENSNDFYNFRQLFPDLKVPSFNVLRQNQVIDIIGDDVSVEEVRDRISKIVGESSSSASKRDSFSRNEPRRDTLHHPSPKVAKKSRVEKLKREQPSTREPATKDTAQLPPTGQKPINKPVVPEPIKEPNPQSHQPICILSIKLFDGVSVRQQFEPSDTLATVREWLDANQDLEVIPDAEAVPAFASSTSPTGYLFCRPVVPVRTFTAEDEASTLASLELCPRSALILKPLYDTEGASSKRQSIFGTIGSSISRVGSALFSFFDYGLHDDMEGNRAQSPLSDEINQNPPPPPLMSISNPPSQATSRVSTPMPSTPRAHSFRQEPEDRFNGNSVNLHDDHDLEQL